jgi:serine/threonine protein kinase
MLSNYTIEPYSSNGHFSTLYKGIHKIKQHKVIVKTYYDDTSKILLENELKIYSYLLNSKYKHIPVIKNIGHLYVIMEYKSQTLQHVTIDILYQLKCILEHLHKLNVIHRDIKPENFLVDQNKLYIIDFGLSTFHSNTICKGLIGNKKYCSYNCHTTNYIYDFKDDMISMIYMCLDLHNGYVPWNEDYTIKQHFKEFYSSNTINDILFKWFEPYSSLL